MDENRGDHEDHLARRLRLLDEWAARERQIAIIQAEQAVLLSERLDLLAAEPDFDHGGDVSLRSLAAEYAAAAHIPPSTAAGLLTDAWMLVHQYPLTLTAFQAGLISRRHVDVILNEAPDVEKDQDAATLRSSYEERVVPFAEGDTAARTRAHARGVAAALSPDATTAAHRRGRARRKVTVTPAGDGMATLTALLPELLAYAIKDRLTAQAKQVVTARAAAGNSASAPERPVSDDVLPELPDDAYERFLQDLAEDEAGSEGDAAEGAGSEGAAPAQDLSAGSSAVPDARPTDAPSGADECDALFIEDFELWSRIAAEHDLLPPPDLIPPHGAEPPPITDDDVPDLDDEWEAILRAFADGFPEDPRPFGPGRLVTFGRGLPEGQIGALELDERTMDQLRADVLADLLLAADPSLNARSGLESVRGTVQVTISANTLIGADDRPAELDGVGPIEPEWARTLAGFAPSLDRLFLDHRGMLTATDSYTPTANMKRFLRARDQHCRFPGCRAPVQRTQGDHNQDHAKGGPTALENLALFCTGHHPIKHPHLGDDDRWTARQLSGGIIEWTSPLGRVYTDVPARRIMFV